MFNTIFHDFSGEPNNYEIKPGKVEKKKNTKPTLMSSLGPLGVPKPKVMTTMAKWTPPARVNTLKKDSPDQFKINLSPGFHVYGGSKESEEFDQIKGKYWLAHIN